MEFIKIDNYNNWYIEVFNDEFQTKSLKYILEHMLIKFEIIFGRDIIDNEECYVYIDSNSACPMLHTGYDKLAIRLSTPETTYWAQVIYQLSHELCHYVLRQTSGGNETLKWFEETLCEAMSMYILKYFYETWDDCILSRNNYNYRESIKKYLEDIYNSQYGTGLAECKSEKQLRILSRLSERDRHERIRERNIVYNIFKSEPDKIKLIAEYQRYRNDIIGDFNEWKNERKDIKPSHCVL